MVFESQILPFSRNVFTINTPLCPKLWCFSQTPQILKKKKLWCLSQKPQILKNEPNRGVWVKHHGLWVNDLGGEGCYVFVYFKIMFLFLWKISSFRNRHLRCVTFQFLSFGKVLVNFETVKRLLSKIARLGGQWIRLWSRTKVKRDQCVKICQWLNILVLLQISACWCTMTSGKLRWMRAWSFISRLVC